MSEGSCTIVLALTDSKDPKQQQCFAPISVALPLDELDESTRSFFEDQGKIELEELAARNGVRIVKVWVRPWSKYEEKEEEEEA